MPFGRGVRRDTGRWQHEIDAYLAAVDEPKRSTLEQLRKTILEVLADAEQGLTYGMPACKVGSKPVVGFAAFRHHLSYLPPSGSVLAALGDEVWPTTRPPKGHSSSRSTGRCPDAWYEG